MQLAISHVAPRLGAAIVRRVPAQDLARMQHPQDFELPVRYRFDRAHAARLVARYNRWFAGRSLDHAFFEAFAMARARNFFGA
jgi:hypothetical protein